MKRGLNRTLGSLPSGEDITWADTFFTFLSSTSPSYTFFKSLATSTICQGQYRTRVGGYRHMLGQCRAWRSTHVGDRMKSVPEIAARRA
eukprot:1191849-Rhodomonas_salina.4